MFVNALTEDVRRILWQAGGGTVLLAAVTGLGQMYFAWLGVTVMTLLYLLCVLWMAYSAKFSLALVTAVLAFLLLNFCFIEPRYTFQIGSLQSWLTLLVFALVALTVSSAMQQLKKQTYQARLSARQSRFFQSLTELFAAHTDPVALLQAGCDYVAQVFELRVTILQLASNVQTLQVLAGDALAAEKLSPSSVQWALDFNRPIGAGTSDWPALDYCLLPLGFQPRAVLAVAVGVSALSLDFLRLLTHQFSQAHFKLTQQLALAESELRASEALFKKTLLTALSHDMRTPLTAMVGAANVLKDQQMALDSTQAQQLLASIQTESQYLIQATENILTLVKLEAGADSLRLDWQFAEEVVQHVVERYQTRLFPQASAQHTLRVELQYAGVLLKIDAMLVAHALANLIDNAIAWHQGAQPITVIIAEEAHWLAVRVSNHGPGFPPDFKIEPFSHPTQRPAGVRGFGLGLFIVDNIMRLHEGRLALSSTPIVTPNSNTHHVLTTVSLLFPRLAMPMDV